MIGEVRRSKLASRILQFLPPGSGLEFLFWLLSMMDPCAERNSILPKLLLVSVVSQQLKHGCSQKHSMWKLREKGG